MITTLLSEIMGESGRPNQLSRIYLSPSQLPRRRNLMELKDRLAVLTDYYDWNRKQRSQAWTLAVRLQKAGSPMGAIIAELENSVI